MRRDPRAYLWEVREAARAIAIFINGLDVQGYEQSDLVQAAVERKFEVIGEALNQLAKEDAQLASRIPDLSKIVAFRNLLIHGYATVNPRTVWGATEHSLPALEKVICTLLSDLGES